MLSDTPNLYYRNINIALLYLFSYGGLTGSKRACLRNTWLLFYQKCHVVFIVFHSAAALTHSGRKEKEKEKTELPLFQFELARL